MEGGPKAAAATRSTRAREISLSNAYLLYERERSERVERSEGSSARTRIEASILTNFPQTPSPQTNRQRSPPPPSRALLSTENMLAQLFLNFASMGILAKDAFPVVAILAFTLANYIVYIYLQSAETRRRKPVYREFFDADRDREREAQAAKTALGQLQNGVLSAVIEEDVAALSAMDEKALGVRVPMWVEGGGRDCASSSSSSPSQPPRTPTSHTHHKHNRDPPKNMYPPEMEKVLRGPKAFSCTPLLFSIGRGKLKSFVALLERAVDVNEAGYGCGPIGTPLACLAMANAIPLRLREMMAEKLIQHGGERSGVEEQRSRGAEEQRSRGAEVKVEMVF